MLTFEIDAYGVPELCAPVYRCRQALFQACKLQAFNEALLSDPTEKHNRSDLQKAYIAYCKRLTLQSSSIAFLHTQYSEKAWKILKTVIEGK